MRPWQHPPASRPRSLRGLISAVSGLTAVVCLLVSAAAYGADCSTLTLADFASVKNKTQDAYDLQKAVTAAYAGTDLDKRRLRLLSDGYIGTTTVKQFVQFCTDINLPATDDLPAKLIAALVAFARLTDAQTDAESGQQLWRDRLSDPEFIAWAAELPAGIYGGYFGYYSGAKPMPGGVFLLADYAAREPPVSPPVAAAIAEPVAAAIAEPPLTGLFVLREADFETLKAESVALGSLDNLLGFEQSSRVDLRAEIVSNLGFEGQQSDALVEQLLDSAEVTTSYRIEQKATAQLRIAGLPDQVLEAVAALQQLTFSTEDELKAEIDKISVNLAADYNARITDVLEENPAPGAKETETGSPAPPTTNPEAGANETETNSPAQPANKPQRVKLRATGLPTALLQRLSFPLDSSSGRTVRYVVNQYKIQITDNIEPIDAHTITDNTLADPNVKALTKSIPEPVLKRLAKLTDIQFPNGELFRTAVRLSGGLGQNNILAMNAILRVARKPPTQNETDIARIPPSQNELALAPIQWQGGDCGCGAFESLQSGDNSDLYRIEPYLYGIYPYWHAPQAGNLSNTHEPEIVDFSMLNRIAYYGVTFSAGGYINNPLHFQQKQTEDGWFWQRKNFAQFVNAAHQFKTKVDLVVYNAKWRRWVAAADDSLDEEDAERKRLEVTNRLIESIGSLLTERIEGFTNDIKPVISAGQSPARTMGDGVTFHFDFRALDKEQQQWLFDKQLGEQFFKTLGKSLKERDGSERYGVSYFTNIIVPGQCMTEDRSKAPGCAYYSLGNLNKLMPYVNLVLVDLSTRDPGSDVLSEMKKILAYIEASAQGNEEIALLKKLVPLASLPLGDADETRTEESFRYAEWYFSGLGSWQLNKDEDTRDTLQAVFLASGKTNFLEDIVTKVCNVTCPKRWWLRMFVALFAIVGTIYVIASNWVFGLRKLYARRNFQRFVIFVFAVLIVTFWCDPYWKLQQSFILSFALIAALIFWIISRRRKEQQRQYP